MITSLTSLPVGLTMLLTGFQLTIPDWGNWGDNRSAIEYSSLLTSLSVDPKNNRMELDSKHPLVAVFVPINFSLRAALTKANDTKALHTQDYTIVSTNAYPFHKAVPNGRGERPYVFTESGDYDLAFAARSPTVPIWVPITKVSFHVDLVDDPQRSKPVAVLSGPWESWAYLWFPYGKEDNGRPEVRIWRRIDSPAQTKPDEYTLEILNARRQVIGVAEAKSVSSIQQTRLDFPLSMPENLGGQELLAKEFLAQVGSYYVVVKKNGNREAVYEFGVEKKGQLVSGAYQYKETFTLHENQRAGHKLSEFIVPRMPGPDVDRQGLGDTVWMDRLSNIQVAAMLSGSLPTGSGIGGGFGGGFGGGTGTPRTTMTTNTPNLHPIPMPMETVPLKTIPYSPPQTGEPAPSSPNEPAPTKPLEPLKPDDNEPQVTETKPETAVPESMPLDEPKVAESRSAKYVISFDEDALENIPVPATQQATLESYIGIIVLVLLAHLGIGVFFTVKLLKQS